MESYKEYCMVL